jgi:K+-sensing histidine kinase KdpD
MDSYDTLVIILSVTLAVFLTLAIIATVMIIQILKKVKIVSESAQHTAENVEEFTSNLKNAGKVTAVGSAVNQVINIFKKGSK